jgi:PIN domain nuclease of toxin-antitoxin system
MNTVYVIDTNCLIYYFDEVFQQGAFLSNRARNIIDRSFDEASNIRLSIPSIVFVELFDTQTRDVEIAAKIRYEIFDRIKDSPIEIREIDQEILECLLRIQGRLIAHEIHDKIILASAISLECPLITRDDTIRKYVEETKIIPEVIN